ncbi:MAG TPA: hypothetical protein PKD09_23080 [Aggregatilinea sp.]|uniref:hypothetical protein n=1 Tax=Aggregatilinea sp. TaxID=2806333 RepID=UPI002CAC4BE8|nr:hypothetical protein [Aggregatilinea sp.]HML24555.1 hypothetical protein [Aggregatilinea sp.]
MASITPPTRTCLLLDVDGVLLHAAGYKVALRDTVNHFTAQMGLPAWGPDEDEVSLFEACGITNEWDSGAMCLGALLAVALADAPHLRRGTLDETLAAVAEARLSLARPDFRHTARLLRDRQTDGLHPAAIYLALLGEQLSAEDLPLFSALLADVYSIDAPTTRVFQTHTLGSERFEETYGFPAPFESPSYLKAYDVPLLSDESRARLLDWHAQPGHGAVVFTARPSLPPADVPDRVLRGYPPEGELATELLALDGQLILMGQGRVSWLAAQNGRDVTAYVKPSPVQALAAIGAAVSGEESTSLHAAADFVERGLIGGPLDLLREGQTHVIVCEDAINGIRAARGAVDRLRAAGLDVTFEAVGISPHPDKRAALAAVADRVVDDINAGLAEIGA